MSQAQFGCVVAPDTSDRVSLFDDDEGMAPRLRRIAMPIPPKPAPMIVTVQRVESATFRVASMPTLSRIALPDMLWTLYHSTLFCSTERMLCSEWSGWRQIAAAAGRN